MGLEGIPWGVNWDALASRIAGVEYSSPQQFVPSWRSGIS